MPHLSRRSILSLSCALALTACAAPLVQEDVASQIAVRSVAVDVSGYGGIEGRNLDIPADQLKADLTAALTKQLEVSGSGNTDVAIKVDKVFLLSPGSAAMVGGLVNSRITALVSARDATGQTLLPATEMGGNSEKFRMGGILGAAMTPSAQDDYAATVSGFAKVVRKRLLDKDTPVP